MVGFSFGKIILSWVVVLILGTAGFFAYRFYFPTSETIVSEETADISSNINLSAPDNDFEGIATEGEDIALTDKESEEQALKNSKAPRDPSDKSQNFNVLVLGIDRRHGDQKNWRTDVIQLITLNPNRTRGIVTHIPRDVWAGSYKINAIYNLRGPEETKDIVQEITGQRPDRIIRVDFDAFAWMVDSVGGLTINVPNGFTDSSYPNDRKGSEEIITVSFETGEQVMDGEKALIYVRSRKGTNGEGSDYARGYRQQIVMDAIIDDFFNPNNLFKPKTAETLFNIATQKIYTDINLSDAKVLFEVLKNYKSIDFETLGLSTENYLVVPADRSQYGGAWTLIAKGNDYSLIHQKINSLLNPLPDASGID